MKLIMTKGLPGSGKSTWAKEYIALNPNTKRINKDDLRRMLDNSKWSKENEKFVLKVRDQLVRAALFEHRDVIVDDTNLAPKHETQLRAIAMEKAFNAEFEVKDFTYVSIETCIANDLKRLDSVGEQVIRKMYNQFLRPKIDPPVWNPNLPVAIMCDIDGTLALFGDANPYDRDFGTDELNVPIKIIVNRIGDDLETRIILLSGRKDKFRKVTEAWLDHNDVQYHDLFMRKTDDNRHDYIVKEEIYRREIEGKYNVLFVLDDRNQVVDLWRRLGLTCLQVAEGDF